MKNIQVIKNGMFEVAVRENGVNVEFDVEALAKNLGFIRVQGEKIYVRWERVNGYLSEMGYAQQVGKGDFIPESYVYMLGMKGETDLALNFQKFLAFEVLPQIRKNKVYIDPSATDKEIDNAVRFATPQKRRTALMDATIDGKQSVFNLYEDIKQFIENWTGKEKITALEHIERVLLDKQLTYGNDVAFAHKVEELLRVVAKDLDKVKNWINGATKRGLNKTIIKLKQKNEELEPDISDYHIINYHGFSENYMYEPTVKNEQQTLQRTNAYNSWINNFPVDDMIHKDHFNIKWDKPITMFLAFDCLEGMDVQNFQKSIIDRIFDIYGENDMKIREIKLFKNEVVNTYEDGIIYFLLRN